MSQPEENPPPPAVAVAGIQQATTTHETLNVTSPSPVHVENAANVLLTEVVSDNSSPAVNQAVSESLPVQDGNNHENVAAGDTVLVQNKYSPPQHPPPSASTVSTTEHSNPTVTENQTTPQDPEPVVEVSLDLASLSLDSTLQTVIEPVPTQQTTEHVVEPTSEVHVEGDSNVKVPAAQTISSDHGQPVEIKPVEPVEVKPAEHVEVKPVEHVEDKQTEHFETKAIEAVEIKPESVEIKPEDPVQHVPENQPPVEHPSETHSTEDHPSTLPTEVSSTPVEPTPVLPQRRQASRIFAMAQWAHDPMEDNEIGFQPSTIIEVLARPNDDWWEGRLALGGDDRVGLFPANRVVLMDDQANQNIVNMLKQVESLDPFATDTLDNIPISPSPVHHATPVGEIPSDASSAEDNSSLHSHEIPQSATEDKHEDNPAATALVDEHGDALPPFWRRAVEPDTEDPNKLKTYYYNVKTEETCWTIPGKAAHEVEDKSLPQGWRAAVDEADGSVYYFNEATGQTSWEKPGIPPPVEASPVSENNPTLPPRRTTSQPTGPPPPAPRPQVAQSTAPILFAELVPPQFVLRAGPASLRLEKGTDPFMKKDWKPVWCIICRGVLAYFKVDTPPNQQRPIRGFVLLEGAHLSPANKDQTKKKSALSITTKAGLEFLLLAKDDADLRIWADAMINACAVGVDPTAVQLIQRFAQGSHSSLADKNQSSLSLDSFTNFLAGNSGRKSPVQTSVMSKPVPVSPTTPQPIPHDMVFGGYIGAQLAKEGGTIPKVVQVCIQQVDERGLHSTGIYRISGNTGSIQRLKALFNAAHDPIIPPEDMHDVNGFASLLKLYFRELADPLFPYATYSKFMDAGRLDNYDDRLGVLKDLIQALPPPHYTVLEYLMRHLQRVAALSDENKMEPSNLAIVFGPTLFRQANESGDAGLLSMMNMSLHNSIIEEIIVQSDWIFDGSKDA